jgi:hypothetical protein
MRAVYTKETKKTKNVVLRGLASAPSPRLRRNQARRRLTPCKNWCLK